MSQAKRSKKIIRHEKSPVLDARISRRTREGVLIVMVALSAFMLLALMTYHASDPSWSYAGTNQHILNRGGWAGAMLADLTLYLFGYVGYVFPFMLCYGAWLFYYAKVQAGDHSQRKILMSLRCVGFILILLGGCGFASANLTTSAAHLPYTAGGILGNGVGFGMQSLLGVAGATLLLLAMFIAGITLFTGVSWLKLFKLIGIGGWFGLSKAGKGGFSLVKLFSKIRLRKSDQAETIKVAKVKKEPKVRPVVTTPAKAITVAVAKPKRIEPSLRSVQEKQTVLFQPAASEEMPALSMLDAPDPENMNTISEAELAAMSEKVESVLEDFSIEAKVVSVHPGPVVTRFELELAAGTKVSKISSLDKDIARSLSVVSVRIVEVIPGKSVIGLETPNYHRETVRLREILSSKQYDAAKSPLTLALGKDISGHPVIVDLAKMPHLLVAGTTGSGKSVGVNAMLLSLLYKATPAVLRLILIDPKMLELSIYEGIPHLLTPVVTDMKDAANALRWCVQEMDRRYQLMASLGVRNLAGYNSKIEEAKKRGTPLLDPLWQQNILNEDEEQPELITLPNVVVVVDEFADLMMVVGKKVEELITRIAQKARAAGIHLILATQRPSVDVITGLIKANIPTRIAFQVSSGIDSRTILDQRGAEQLLGQGDMLYLPPGTGVPIRVHGAFVADDEVHRVVKDWKKRGAPDYLAEITQGGQELLGLAADGDAEKDDLYDQAVKIVTETRKASISSLQRRLKIGYNRAARMVETMETAGVVSEMQSNGSREVLAPPPMEV